MNTELKIHSIVRPKKPKYEHGKAHKVFENKLRQDFIAKSINQKWCTERPFQVLCKLKKLT